MESNINTIGAKLGMTQEEKDLVTEYETFIKTGLKNHNFFNLEIPGLGKYKSSNQHIYTLCKGVQNKVISNYFEGLVNKQEFIEDFKVFGVNIDEDDIYSSFMPGEVTADKLINIMNYYVWGICQKVLSYRGVTRDNLDSHYRITGKERVIYSRNLNKEVRMEALNLEELNWELSLLGINKVVIDFLKKYTVEDKDKVFNILRKVKMLQVLLVQGHNTGGFLQRKYKQSHKEIFKEIDKLNDKEDE